jgi:hypothetical protein
VYEAPEKEQHNSTYQTTRAPRVLISRKHVDFTVTTESKHVNRIQALTTFHLLHLTLTLPILPDRLAQSITRGLGAFIFVTWNGNEKGDNIADIESVRIIDM